MLALPMRRTFLQFTMALGCLSLALGLTWLYAYGRPASGDFINRHDEFGFLIPIGILLATIGIIAWSPRVEPNRRVKAAGWIFCGGLIGFIAPDKNVHGPGMVVSMCAVYAFGVSLVLALTDS